MDRGHARELARGRAVRLHEGRGANALLALAGKEDIQDSEALVTVALLVYALEHGAPPVTADRLASRLRDLTASADPASGRDLVRVQEALRRPVDSRDRGLVHTETSRNRGRLVSDTDDVWHVAVDIAGPQGMDPSPSPCDHRLMGHRPLCLALLVIVLTSCGGSEPSMVHMLRSWPMDVPGMNYVVPASFSENPEAEPQTRHMCGEVYACCYMIQCFDADANVRVEAVRNIPLCPAQFGYGSTPTRYIAYYLWMREYVGFARTDAKRRYNSKACYVNEANCRSEAHAGSCGNYPEP